MNLNINFIQFALIIVTEQEKKQLPNECKVKLFVMIIRKKLNFSFILNTLDLE